MICCSILGERTKAAEEVLANEIVSGELEQEM